MTTTSTGQQPGHQHGLIPDADTLRDRAGAAVRACGVQPERLAGGPEVTSPINGAVLASPAWATAGDVAGAVERGRAAYLTWREVPAPVRGNLVRNLADLLRLHKQDLGELITCEVGKVRSEAEGEVQEMIDVCDFGVGLSRQLYGSTIASERPGHRMMETWHPLGVVGVITAFNFPAAVWSWNTVIALTCGNAVVWKPSELTPLTSLAIDALVRRAISAADAPEALSQLVLGAREVGEALVENTGVDLVSATGSSAMGRVIGPRVAHRFGRSLLELGGNNAAIVGPSADLDLTTRGVLFAAVGTAGQRCTTLRRIIVHESLAEELTARLVSAYESLPIGSPMAGGTLVGPVIHGRAYAGMVDAIERAKADGGEVLTGGERVLTEHAPDAYYVRPALVRMPAQTEVVREETFAPLAYVLTYSTLDEAIELNNSVPQGLSSAIFTQELKEAERFMSAVGSDCGIANVNIGTSGAEIGGAFGGEKETGGGRESGSDAWKSYMRRATNTINYSDELPLAQGVEF
jgi:aldehyde dehydrogenase (NAD+)